MFSKSINKLATCWRKSQKWEITSDPLVFISTATLGPERTTCFSFYLFLYMCMWVCMYMYSFYIYSPHAENGTVVLQSFSNIFLFVTFPKERKFQFWFPALCYTVPSFECRAWLSLCNHLWYWGNSCRIWWMMILMACSRVSSFCLSILITSSLRHSRWYFPSFTVCMCFARPWLAMISERFWEE